jgi:protein-tyrosine phosphatase
VTNDGDRRIAFERVFNFRDLGGWPTTDGRTVRWRTLYRADTLHRIEGADLELLGGLGLRTVVDLRSAQEIDEHGRLKHDGIDLTVHHLGMVDDVGSSPATRPTAQSAAALPADAGEAYVNMTERGRRSIARAIALLAEPGALPGVFHCTAGKDRTGIVAALLLSALGVGDDDVASDYLLTAESRGLRQAFLDVNDPEYAAFLAALPAWARETKVESIVAVLDHVRTVYGSAAEFLVSGGLTGDALERLASTVLES